MKTTASTSYIIIVLPFFNGQTVIYPTGELGTAIQTESYTYGNTSWGDLLTGFKGYGITYDSIGNPITFAVPTGEAFSASWQGRRLMTLTGNSKTLSFTYNADGIRTGKNVNGQQHEYILNGTQVVAERIGSNFLVYLYDQNGSPIGLGWGSASLAPDQYNYYFFDKNLQGDIVAVYNQNGVKLGTYTYDAWGNHTVTPEAGNTAMENQILTTYNPFRYRGYFYDVETGLYYLQSRYYNPEWGRFLNADDFAYLGANGDLQAFNLFAYCSNNPITYADVTGEFIGALVGGAIGAAFGALSGYISAVQSGDDIKMAVISGAVTGAVIGAMGAAIVDPTSLLVVSAASGVVAAANDIVNQTYNYCKEQKNNADIKAWADNMDWGSVAYSTTSTIVGTALGGITGTITNNAFRNVPSGVTKTIAQDIVAGSHFSFITNGAQMVGDFFYSIVKG